MKLAAFTRKLLTAATFALLSTAASAGINGDTVGAAFFVPTLSGPGYSVGTDVVPVAAFDVFGLFNVHVSDTQIIVDHFYGVDSFNMTAFNGFQITDLSKNFGGVYTVDGSTTMVDFSAAHVATSGNTVSVNMAGLAFTEDTRIVLNLSPVPEPESYAMLLAGLGLTGLVLRRRQA
ncbi:MAG: PEP-CTERM sorting domain-containing protein [Pseudomonadota bacterium]